MTYYELSERRDEFIPEIWTLYAIGMTILLLRFAIRLRTVGIRGLQWDDLFAFIVIALYTIDAATVHIVYHSGTNIEGTALVYQKNQTLTQPELDQLTEGSKVELLAWYSYATLVWCLKGTMVTFFLRMTAGVTKRRTVAWIGYACIASYVAVFFTITFGCWPLAGNFQIIPDPGLLCTLKPQNFIVMTVLNVLTDAAILSIPLPMLWTLQVPPKQKIVIGVLLSSGVFVISAALIRIALTFAAAPSALNINGWGVRETLVGIIAVNAPILRPLFNKKFWSRGPYSGGGLSKGALSGQAGTGANGHHSQAPRGPYELAPSVNSRTDTKRHHRSDGFNGSEESIINKRAGSDSSRIDAGPNEVIVHTLYEVTEGPRSSSNSQWEQGVSHKATAYGGGSPL